MIIYISGFDYKINFVLSYIYREKMEDSLEIKLIPFYRITHKQYAILPNIIEWKDTMFDTFTQYSFNKLSHETTHYAWTIAFKNNFQIIGIISITPSMTQYMPGSLLKILFTQQYKQSALHTQVLDAIQQIYSIWNRPIWIHTLKENIFENTLFALKWTQGPNFYSDNKQMTSYFFFHSHACQLCFKHLCYIDTILSLPTNVQQNLLKISNIDTFSKISQPSYLFTPLKNTFAIAGNSGLEQKILTDLLILKNFQKNMIFELVDTHDNKKMRKALPEYTQDKPQLDLFLVEMLKQGRQAPPLWTKKITSVISNRIDHIPSLKQLFTQLGHTCPLNSIPKIIQPNEITQPVVIQPGDFITDSTQNALTYWNDTSIAFIHHKDIMTIPITNDNGHKFILRSFLAVFPRRINNNHIRHFNNTDHYQINQQKKPDIIQWELWNDAIILTAQQPFNPNELPTNAMPSELLFSTDANIIAQYPPNNAPPLQIFAEKVFNQICLIAKNIISAIKDQILINTQTIDAFQIFAIDLLILKGTNATVTLYDIKNFHDLFITPPSIRISSKFYHWIDNYIIQPYFNGYIHPNINTTQIIDLPHITKPIQMLQNFDHRDQVIQYVQNQLQIDQPHNIFTLNDIPITATYSKTPSQRKSLHVGQYKLFISEIRFIQQYAPKDIPFILIYAGSAPGHHDAFLANMFPNMKMILIDPMPHHILNVNQIAKDIDVIKDSIYFRFSSIKKYQIPTGTQIVNQLGNIVTFDNTQKAFGNVHHHTLCAQKLIDIINYDIENKHHRKFYIIEDFFNEEFAYTFSTLKKKHKVLYVSDIRTNLTQFIEHHDIDKDEENDEIISPSDLDIIVNNAQQHLWIDLLQPDTAMLKFRAPFHNPIDITQVIQYAYSIEFYKNIIILYKQRFNFDIVQEYLNNTQYEYSWCHVDHFDLQTFHGPASTETRAIITLQNIQQPTLCTYSYKLYEQTLFAYNIIREYLCYTQNDPYFIPEIGIDCCPDCNIVINTFIQYSQSTDPITVKTLIRNSLLSIRRSLIPSDKQQRTSTHGTFYYPCYHTIDHQMNQIITHGNQPEVIQQLSSKHSQIFKQASQNEQYAIAEYKKNSKQLRDWKIPHGQIQNIIDGLTSLINKTQPIGQWIMVCHGFTPLQQFDINRVHENDIIDSLKDSFISTTTDCDLACLFTNAQRIILKILLPPETKGFYIGSIEQQMQIMHENEFLLPPNTTFKIIHIPQTLIVQMDQQLCAKQFDDQVHVIHVIAQMPSPFEGYVHRKHISDQEIPLYQNFVKINAQIFQQLHHKTKYHIYYYYPLIPNKILKYIDYTLQPIIIMDNWNENWEYNYVTDYFTENIRFTCKYQKYDVPENFWKIHNNDILLKIHKKSIDTLQDYLSYRELLYKDKQFKLCNNFRISLLNAIFKILKPRKILDMCAGWGDRLIAAIAHNVDEYLGVDPNKLLHPLYDQIIQTLVTPDNRNKFKIIQDGFETAHIPNKDYDLALFCPPFFDLETYSKEDKDSIITYPTMEKWVQGFIIGSIDKAIEHLTMGGFIFIYLYLVDGQQYVEQTIKHLDTILTRVNDIIYADNTDKTPKLRTFYVWQKLPPTIMIDKINFQHSQQQWIIQKIHPSLEIERKNIIQEFITRIINLFPKHMHNQKLNDKVNSAIVRFCWKNIGKYDPVIPYHKNGAYETQQLMTDLEHLRLKINEEVYNHLDLDTFFQNAIQKLLVSQENIPEIHATLQNDTLVYQNISIPCPHHILQRLDEAFTPSETIQKEDLYFATIYRYQVMGAGNQQLAAPTTFKQKLAKTFHIDTELFASCINREYRTYCSIFYDLEKFFGSVGNFFDTTFKTGVYFANPPFDETIMKNMAQHLIKCLQQTQQPLAFFVTIPVWDFVTAKRLQTICHTTAADFGDYQVYSDLMRSAYVYRVYTMCGSDFKYIDKINNTMIPAANTYMIVLKNSYMMIDLSVLDVLMSDYNPRQLSPLPSPEPQPHKLHIQKPSPKQQPQKLHIQKPSPKQQPQTPPEQPQTPPEQPDIGSLFEQSSQQPLNPQKPLQQQPLQQPPQPHKLHIQKPRPPEQPPRTPPLQPEQPDIGSLFEQIPQQPLNPQKPLQQQPLTPQKPLQQPPQPHTSIQYHPILKFKQIQ